MNPFKFLDDLFTVKTRVLGLSVGEDFVIIACVVLAERQKDAVRRMDGQTEGQLDRS